MKPRIAHHEWKGVYMANQGQYPQNQNPQNYQYHQTSQRSENFQYPKPKSGMAITGLVLGIIALLTSFLPIINNASFSLDYLALFLHLLA